MKIVKNMILLLVVSLFISCGSSKVDTSVTVIDGSYITNAIVKDAIGNVAIPGNNGVYNFGLKATFPVTVTGGRVGKKNVDINMSIKSGNIISPISTIINSGVTVASIAKAIDYKGDVTVNYLKDNKPSLAIFSNAIYFYLKEGKMHELKVIISENQIKSKLDILINALSKGGISQESSEAIEKLIFLKETKASKIEDIVIEYKYNPIKVVTVENVIVKVLDPVVVTTATVITKLPIITGVNAMTITFDGNTSYNIGAKIEGHTSVTYHSTNLSIATVSANGLILPLKEGNVSIIIKAVNGVGGFNKSVAIVVKKGGTPPTINFLTSVTLKINDSRTIATFKESNVTAVYFVKSGSSHISINASGSVKGLSVGTSEIQVTATASNGDTKSVLITVKVIKADATTFPLVISPATISVAVGHTKSNLATYENSHLQTFYIPDSEIATVTADGTIFGVKEGNTTIRFIAYDTSGNNMERTVKVIVTKTVTTTPSTNTNPTTSHTVITKDGKLTLVVTSFTGQPTITLTQNVEKIEVFFGKGGFNVVRGVRVRNKDENTYTTYYDKLGSFVTNINDATLYSGNDDVSQFVGGVSNVAVVEVFIKKENGDLVQKITINNK